MLIIGLGQYPNLGVTDAFALASHGDTHRVVRASRPLGADRMDTTVGPFRVEVIEGLRSHGASGPSVRASRPASSHGIRRSSTGCTRSVAVIECAEGGATVTGYGFFEYWALGEHVPTGLTAG